MLIVDEAGMVSSRQMSELLTIAERQSARIVFSGDTRQIQSVEAGDALRVLEKESRLKSTSLTKVQRQTAADYREAIRSCGGIRTAGSRSSMRSEPFRKFRGKRRLGR